MQAVKHGGISGKARRVRHRNRAARLYTQQMIEEYLEPGGATMTSDRYIPIRGRSDFLPSVTPNGGLFSAGADSQLELPLTTDASDKPVARPAQPHRSDPEQKSDTTTDSAIRFPRDDRRTDEFDPRRLDPAGAKGGRPAGTFTIGGFLVGCAIGSAAAALVLLVVQTAIG